MWGALDARCMLHSVQPCRSMFVACRHLYHPHPPLPLMHFKPGLTRLQLYRQPFVSANHTRAQRSPYPFPLGAALAALCSVLA